jgi:hypothetical protein
MNLEARQLTDKAEVTLYTKQESKPFNKSTMPNADNFVLRPDPMLRLERIAGCNPKFQSGKVYFSKDDRRTKEVLYTQANMLIGYYEPTQKQRVFTHAAKEPIDQFHLFGNFGITSQKASAKEIDLSVWDMDQESEALITFRPPLSLLKSVSLSSDQELLCLGGKDHQKRDLILIYKFKDLAVYKKVEIHVRQLSDFDLADIRFNDITHNTLVSCGKENIRVFKLKTTNGSPLLTAQTVALNSTGRGKTFTSSLVDFEWGDKGQKKPMSIFCTTTDGLLYIVNYNSRVTEKVI